MLPVVLLMITTCWIQVVIGVNCELCCQPRFPYELRTLRRVNNTATWRNCRLKFGNTDQRRTHITLTMHFSFNKSCLLQALGNCEMSREISRVQVEFVCLWRHKGHTKTMCLFKPNARTTILRRLRMCQLDSVKFGNGVYHDRIVGLNLIRGCLGRVIPEENTIEIMFLALLCTQCTNMRRGLGDRDEVSFGRTPVRIFFTRKRILVKKSLRKRRHILGNTSSTYAFSTYFSPYATGVSPTLPVTRTNVRQSLSPPQQRSFIFCPQSAVIKNSTIVLAKPARHFKGTLVPTSKLTPLPRVVDIVQSAPSTFPTRGSVQAMTHVGALVNATPSSWYRSQYLRTSTANANFIYSSRLVSIVYAASNSSFAFITTLNCATVTDQHASSASINAVAPTTVSAPSKMSPHKTMKWVMGLVVAGGTISGFVFIAMATMLIRRYRRARNIRRNDKQISYFNRYDPSVAWEEPFGGSRLSVFTLKNSKFDIDWENPNEGKRKESNGDEDFEGR